MPSSTSSPAVTSYLGLRFSLITKNELTFVNVIKTAQIKISSVEYVTGKRLICTTASVIVNEVGISVLISNWVWTLMPDLVLLNQAQSYNDRHKSIVVELKA